MREKGVDQTLEEMLKTKTEIPDVVTDRIEEVCQGIEKGEYNLNIVQNDNPKVDSKIVVAEKKRRKFHWSAAILAASIAVVGAVGVMAATGVFSFDKKVEEDTVKGDVQVDTTEYDFSVDQSVKVKDIKVTATYVPDGFAMVYVDMEEGKEKENVNSQYMFAEKRDGDDNYISGYGISIYNAAKLAYVDAAWKGEVLSYQQVSGEEHTKIQNMDTRIFTYKSEVGVTYETILMFNAMDGYMIELTWCLDENQEINLDIMKKVAEGLDVQKLDTEVEYLSEEEIAAIKQKAESDQAEVYDYYNQLSNVDIPADKVNSIAEPFQTNALWSMGETDDVEVTVTEVTILDSLDQAVFDMSHYEDYDGMVALWVAEDGTLLPHSRISENRDTRERTIETDCKSSFAVVTVKEKNISDQNSDMAMPYLISMIKNADGSLSYPRTDLMGYDGYMKLQWQTGMATTANAPIYCSLEDEYSEAKAGRMFGEHTIEPGGESEYTAVYVVDQDQIAQMALTFDLDEGTDFVYVNQ